MPKLGVKMEAKFEPKAKTCTKSQSEKAASRTVAGRCEAVRGDARRCRAMQAEVLSSLKEDNSLLRRLIN